MFCWKFCGAEFKWPMSENAAVVELRDHVLLGTKRSALSPGRLTWSTRSGFVRLKAMRATLSVRGEMMNLCSSVLNRLRDVSPVLNGGKVFGWVESALSTMTRPNSE